MYNENMKKRQPRRLEVISVFLRANRDVRSHFVSTNKLYPRQFSKICSNCWSIQPYHPYRPLSLSPKYKCLKACFWDKLLLYTVKNNINRFSVSRITSPLFQKEKPLLCSQCINSLPSVPKLKPLINSQSRNCSSVPNIENHSSVPKVETAPLFPM